MTPHTDTVANTNQKPNVLDYAREALGRRLRELADANYLDGQPAKLTAIMQATNRVREIQGLKQIVTNDAWRV